jgi:hypothetical protein
LSRYGAVFLGLALLSVASCQKITRTNDPQLKPIQEMLDAQVPPGISDEKVMSFLESSGYVVIPAQKPGTIVATIHAARQEASQVNARVTFYFDANHKLNTFELQRISDIPHPQ